MKKRMAAFLGVIGLWAAVGVAAPSETLRIGSTTMQDVLTLYGAPHRIVPLEGRGLFI